ncbi:alanine racemase, partial [Escherichia coli]|nr:alanine racemase [Escherichia coli]
LNVIRQITGNADIMAVVKADAYGHGARVCAEKLQDAGVKWFAVATLGEALELREAGNTGRILVLGGCWPGEEKAFFEFALTPAVFTLEQVRR